MSKLFRNVLLLAKIQPTAGTDPVPTAAANSILARALQPKPAVVETADRNNIQPYLGNAGKIITAVYSSMEFEVENQASGTLGTAPKFGPLHRACALGETIVAVTSVAYAPITSAMELVTLYWYMDGILHKMTDCRADVSFSFSAKGIPVMKYKFWGFYSTPTDTAIPGGADYSGFMDPLPVSKVNTPTFTLHGFSAKVMSLDIALNNQLTYRNIIGSEEVKIVDRSPSGTIVMESPDTIAAKNWFSTLTAGTTGALAMTHGTVAGKKVQVAAPKVLLTNLDYQESDGVAMLSAALDFQPSTGNDEVVFTYV